MIETPRPGLLVIDASALVMLVASGAPAGDLVARAIAEMTLFAPAILPTEVDATLRGLVLGGKLDPRQGDHARQRALGMPIELWPWHPLSARAWDLRANLSTYDAGYVALAEHLGAPLLTADARIARASGVHCAVQVVG